MTPPDVNAVLMKYFDTVDWDPAVRERLRDLSRYAEEFSPEPIRQVFISETIDTENARDYQSGWFLSQNFALEFFDLMAGKGEPTRFDVTPMSGRVVRIQFTVVQFAGNRASASSRMAVEFATTELVTGILRASGAQNCRWLRSIADDFIVRWTTATEAPG